MTSPELVAATLKKLVGHRAEPHRLAVCPELRQLAGVNGQAQQMAGYMIRRYLQEQIGSLNGSHPIEGKLHSADVLRRCLHILLGLDGRKEWAEVRRYRVIALLGIYCGVDKWRKVPGPEMELLLLLARHLTRPPN